MMLIIVSGFPRCGTSLMMRILVESGIPAHYENPRTFETSQVRQINETRESTQWVRDLPDGTALKLMFYRLAFIPADRDYKIIWMVRNAEACAKSRAMITRHGSNWRKTAEVIRKVNKSVPWRLRREYDVEVVWFGRLLRDPALAVAPVEEMLGVELDVSCVKIRTQKHSELPMGTLESTPTEEMNG